MVPSDWDNVLKLMAAIVEDDVKVTVLDIFHISPVGESTEHQPIHKTAQVILRLETKSHKENEGATANPVKKSPWLPVLSSLSKVDLLLLPGSPFPHSLGRQLGAESSSQPMLQGALLLLLG